MGKEINPNMVYDVQQAAEVLGIDDQQVTKLCRLGKIKAIQVKKWLILGQNLIDWLKGGNKDEVGQQ